MKRERRRDTYTTRIHFHLHNCSCSIHIIFCVCILRSRIVWLYSLGSVSVEFGSVGRSMGICRVQALPKKGVSIKMRILREIQVTKNPRNNRFWLNWNKKKKQKKILIRLAKKRRTHTHTYIFKTMSAYKYMKYKKKYKSLNKYTNNEEPLIHRFNGSQ